MTAGELALHDKVEIDGDDWSSLLRGWDIESENAQVEAGGMSVSGTDEFLDGPRASAIILTFKYTEELNAALWPIHSTRDSVTVELQPKGLIDSGREIWYGECALPSYPPGAARGDLRVVTTRWVPADENGIRQYAAS